MNYGGGYGGNYGGPDPGDGTGTGGGDPAPGTRSGRPFSKSRRLYGSRATRSKLIASMSNGTDDGSGPGK
jgi:hypothetical protein